MSPPVREDIDVDACRDVRARRINAEGDQVSDSSCEHAFVTGQSRRSLATLDTVRINTTGERQLLAVELADKESADSWTTFLTGLKEWGLPGVEYVVSDSHEGLKRAIEKVLTTALWQRCVVHFLRNALTHTTHQTDPKCLNELKLLWSCSGMKAARTA